MDGFTAMLHRSPTFIGSIRLEVQKRSEIQQLLRTSLKFYLLALCHEVPISIGAVSDIISPRFSPSGKYLYFIGGQTGKIRLKSDHSAKLTYRT
jgi:hypothetical protein